MAIRAKTHAKRVIDIDGPDGNAFALLAYANTFGKQLGFDKEKLSKIRDEMMSGDYQNLLKVFDANFGHVVDLVSDNFDDEDE